MKRKNGKLIERVRFPYSVSFPFSFRFSVLKTER
jgi:hypothetical protein